MRAGFYDEGYGYDVFGLHPPSVDRWLRAAVPLYRHYFNVGSQGWENVPAEGGAILVANHSGVLPIDAAMLWVDVEQRTGRFLRTVADRFVPMLPIVSSVFARTGVVSGTHANVRRLLERGELISIFPEGITGPAKPFRDRYKLQQWRVGHAELALRYRVPVIPIAIIGAEESWPMLLRLPLRVFGSPYLPLPRSPLPLPRHLEIHYGRPIELAGDPDDPACVAAAATRTHDAVATLIEHGLATRSPS